MRASRLTRLLCAGSLVIMGSVSMLAAQSSPFDESPEFGEPVQGDPFAGQAPVADPFGTVGGTAQSPFGESPANAAPPEGEVGDFFDPFAGAAGDPAAEGDPFGAAAAGDPFGAPDAAGDPFGAASAGDPFGAPAAGDPFGAPSGTPAAVATAGGDPFGADPFGANPAAGTDPAAAPAGAAPRPAGEAITDLYEWRYRQQATWDGRVVVVRRRMTRSEAEAFDQEQIDALRERIRANQLAGYDGTSDPNTWAQWNYFADQLYLWSEYVDTVVLAGSNEGRTAYEKVEWPGVPQIEGAEGGQEFVSSGGAERLVEQTQNQSLDDQTASFFVSPENQSETQGFLKYTAIRDQVLSAYTDSLGSLRSMEGEQQAYMIGFEDRLQERASRRVAYGDWQADQMALIEDFVTDWSRRYNGEVAMIGGVRYELYRPGQVPARVRRETNIVVTDFRLTPYDILTEDGQLRTPSRD